MSHIYWERMQPAEFIQHAYQEKTIDALMAYFGAFPIILAEEHLPLLRSWLAIGGGRPLGELIAAVEVNKEIRVWWDVADWKRVMDRERGRLPRRASYQPREEIDEDAAVMDQAADETT